MKRIMEEAWGFATTTLTKEELKTLLLARGCTISTRRRGGDFKPNAKKQTLVDLLHTKLPVPPPHTSVSDFLMHADERAQAEGTAAVLAMSGQSATPRPVTTESNVSSSSDTSDSESDLPLNVVRSRLRVSRDASVAPPQDEDLSVADFLEKAQVDTGTVDESSDSDDGDSDNSQESVKDPEGVVCVGDKFVYSDYDEEGDSTLTVQRIVRGDLVYVEEDDDTLCLSYVRRKVREYIWYLNGI